MHTISTAKTKPQQNTCNQESSLYFFWEKKTQKHFLIFFLLKYSLEKKNSRIAFFFLKIIVYKILDHAVVL